MTNKPGKTKLKDFLKRFASSNIPVQIKIYGSLSILMLIAFVTYFFILDTYYQENKKKEIEMISRMNRQAADSIDIYIQDLSLLTTYPLYDKDTISLMVYIKNKIDQYDNEHDISFGDSYLPERNTFLSSGISLSEEEGLSNLINAISSNKKYIFASFLFETKGYPIIHYLPVGVLAKQYIASENIWFVESIEASGLPVVSETFPKMETMPKNKNSTGYVFTVSRAIKDLNSVDILGVISVLVDASLFEESIEKIYSISGERFLIVNREGKIIFDSEKSNISQHISETDMSFIDIDGILYSMNDYSSKNNGQDYLIMSTEISEPDWIFIRVVPEAGLEKGMKSTQLRLASVIIVFFAFCLLVAFVLSNGITKPIKKILSVMKVAEKGDLSVRTETKGADEMNQLGLGFNSMIAEIEELVHDVYISNYKKKEAELNALQAQINPHFIYNTLESIRMMAKINGDDDASNMLFVLGKLLRYGINAKKQIVTVREEIDHLQDYIKLQNHRFDDKFDLIIDVKKNLLSTKIIKLVFQPVVENAIFHALETIEGKGFIKLTGYRKKTVAVFEISDNGTGMTESQLDDLSSNINDFGLQHDGSRGIGLRNINERIKLYFGTEYGLKIHSTLNEGTKVVIKIPVDQSSVSDKTQDRP